MNMFSFRFVVGLDFVGRMVNCIYLFGMKWSEFISGLSYFGLTVDNRTKEVKKRKMMETE